VTEKVSDFPSPSQISAWFCVFVVSKQETNFIQNLHNQTIKVFKYLSMVNNMSGLKICEMEMKVSKTKSNAGEIFIKAFIVLIIYHFKCYQSKFPTFWFEVKPHRKSSKNN
jgi:hypothetical protein